MNPLVGILMQNALEWDGTLYDSGDEYAGITGGWVVSAANASYTFSKSPTLYIINNTGSFIGEFTTTKIDLTEYASLKFNISAKSGGNFYVGASSAATYSATFDAYTLAPGTGTVSVDVSALSGEYYVGTQLAAGGSTTITKIWLE
jgi:hypothetical protein